MQITSVITGKVRDEKKAFDAAHTLVRYRSMGLLDLLVFSTWLSELDQYPTLREYLRSENFFVIESNPQSTSMQESHQKIPLLAALNLLDSNNYVTRHRFDRAFPGAVFENHLRSIREKGPSPSKVRWAPNKYLVSVHSALLDVPFYINDIVFSGARDDLLNLVSISAMTQLYWSSHINPELSFFASGFLPYFPEIGEYLCTYPGLSYGQATRWDLLKQVQKTSDFYAKVLALHYVLLTQCFDIGYGRQHVVAGDSHQLPLEKCLFEQHGWASTPGLIYNPISGHPYSNTRHLFDLIAVGQYVDGEFSAALSKHVASYLNSNPNFGPVGLPMLRPQSSIYAQALVNAGLLRLPIPGLVEKDGMSYKYFMAQLGGEASKLNRNTSAQDWGAWESLE